MAARGPGSQADRDAHSVPAAQMTAAGRPPSPTLTSRCRHPSRRPAPQSPRRARAAAAPSRHGSAGRRARPAAPRSTAGPVRPAGPRAAGHPRAGIPADRSVQLDLRHRRHEDSSVPKHTDPLTATPPARSVLTNISFTSIGLRSPSASNCGQSSRAEPPDLLRLRTREGMAIARAKGKLKGKPPKLTAPPAGPARASCMPPETTRSPTSPRSSPCRGRRCAGWPGG